MVALNIRSAVLALLASAYVVVAYQDDVLANRQVSRSRIAARSSLERRTNSLFGNADALRSSLAPQFASLRQNAQGLDNARSAPNAANAYDIANVLNKCKGQIGGSHPSTPPKPQPSGSPGSPGQPGNCQDVANAIADILIDISNTLAGLDKILGKLSFAGPILDAIKDLDEELQLLLESSAKSLDKCFCATLKPRCQGRVNFSGRCGLPKCGQFFASH